MAFVLKPPQIKPWHRVSRDKAAQFSIFSVDRVNLVPPGKESGRDFYTVQCPDWCNVIAVTPDNDLVFVWQYRFGTEAFSLETAGGVIDRGEAPIDAARRELIEETGYEAEQIEPLSVLEANPALQPNRCFSFVARGARLTGPQAFDEHEECEVALVPLAHLSDLLDGGHVTHGLIAASLETFLRREAGARR
jgi:ADP-ribose pyrophosphatase